MLLAKVIFLILTLSALCILSISAQTVEYGSFFQFLMGNEPGAAYDHWVSHISEGLALPGYNAYAPWDRQTNGFGNFHFPEPDQLDRWSFICDYFVNQQWQLLTAALVEYEFPYELVEFHDNDVDRTYYMLREHLAEYHDDNGTACTSDDEHGSFDFGWGLAVYNPSANSPIIISVPHPNDDFIAIPLAWKVFTQLNARYLLINGAGREVMWTNQGSYTNSKAISDPSRFADHPLHHLYMRSCDEIRTQLFLNNSIIPREFSLQTHSYDTNLHIGYANNQVSAGNGQFCPNLPIRDLSLTQPDLINAAPYLIHPANTIGNNLPVYSNNFWCVNYSIHPFTFNDGVNQFTVSNQVDLPGYGFNNQMLYSIYDWNNFDVYDPFFHIEMDELPDCYPQNDSTFAWFYGWDNLSQTWRLSNRYTKVVQYYQPWVDALQISLNHTLLMNDNQTPATPIITNASLISANNLRVNWQRQFEYDFHSWLLKVDRLSYQGGGNYTLISTTTYNRNFFTQLADQACTTIDINGLALGFHYRISLASVDKSDRISSYSSVWTVVTYSSPPLVSNLQFSPAMSSNSIISLEWDPLPSNILISYFRIDRRFRGLQDWQTLGTVSQYQNYFTDSNFPNPDTLAYEYRVVTIGYSGQVYIPQTYVTGFFRIYPAPQSVSVNFNPAGYHELAWDSVNNTISGFTDSPDYYLVEKDVSPNFDSPTHQQYIVTQSSFSDPYNETSVWSSNSFYRITAVAAQRSY